MGLEEFIWCNTPHLSMLSIQLEQLFISSNLRSYTTPTYQQLHSSKSRYGKEPCCLLVRAVPRKTLPFYFYWRVFIDEGCVFWRRKTKGRKHIGEWGKNSLYTECGRKWNIVRLFSFSGQFHGYVQLKERPHKGNCIPTPKKNNTMKLWYFKHRKKKWK